MLVERKANRKLIVLFNVSSCDLSALSKTLIYYDKELDCYVLLIANAILCMLSSYYFHALEAVNHSLHHLIVVIDLRPQ